MVLLLVSCGSLSRSRKNSPPEGPSYEHDVLSHRKSKTEPKTEEPRQENTVEIPSEVATRREKLEGFIDDWYGTPHRMGGMTKSGVDCSGFVIIAYREVFGWEFQGRRAEDLFGEMKSLAIEDLRFGDLVFFKVRGRRIDHVGIYLGNLQFAHTSSSRGVMISSLNNAYWSKRVFRGGRYKDS